LQDRLGGVWGGAIGRLPVLVDAVLDVAAPEALRGGWWRSPGRTPHRSI